MIWSASYRKAKRYLKNKSISSLPCSKLIQWIFGSQAVVWNLCASLGLSFLLPRWRIITWGHEDTLSRRDGEGFSLENHPQKPSLQIFSSISLAKPYANHSHWLGISVIGYSSHNSSPRTGTLSHELKQDLLKLEEEGNVFGGVAQ